MLKDDLLKAFRNEFIPPADEQRNWTAERDKEMDEMHEAMQFVHMKATLWAAKWMGELIAHGKNEVVQAPCPDTTVGCLVYHTKTVSRPYTNAEIRTLVKELGGE